MLFCDLVKSGSNQSHILATSTMSCTQLTRVEEAPIHPILEGLTPQQAAGASQMGPVLVLAGAGTGKTKTLTAGVAYRIAVAGIHPSRILAVTFTNKAAKEMQSRISAKVGKSATPSWVNTFHALGNRQLKANPEIAGLSERFVILDADDSKRVLRRILRELKISIGGSGNESERESIKNVYSRIQKFKDNLQTPETAEEEIERRIAAANTSGMPINVNDARNTIRVYKAYQHILRDGNLADFGDLLLWPAREMQVNPEYCGKWASMFDGILADEYQDVNYAQYIWLQMLAQKHREIFVVGDDDQAIYSWRGSEIRYIRQFTEDFPEAVQIRLEQNFRSTRHILDAANAVIALDESRLGKTLFTKKDQGDQIEIVRFPDSNSEAQGVVQEIMRRHAEGISYDDMVILYRLNALSRGFEETLRRSRILYKLIGDVGFYQRAEVKDALALLQLADNADDKQSDEAFRRVINVPPRGFGDKAMQALEEEAARRQAPLLVVLETASLSAKPKAAGKAFANAIRAASRNSRISLADQISLLLDATGYRKHLRESKSEDGEQRLENLQELIHLAQGFHSARELLEHAALATSGPGEDNDQPCVKLMTLHKAKGLEFPHVFLPAWEDGTFPSTYGDPAEERRLAYVALTRGKHRVTISYCDFRRGAAMPSPFIGDIPAENRKLGWLRDEDRHSVASGAPRVSVAKSLPVSRHGGFVRSGY